MNHREGGESLERLLQILAEAEAALAGPGPQAVRTAVERLGGAEEILRSETAAGRRPTGATALREAQQRLQRIQRMVEFGAAYWTGLVSCSVAAEAYGPTAPGVYGVPPSGELHG